MTTMNEPNVKIYTWKEIHEHCKILADKIGTLNLKNFVIVGIARGGFFPALILAHELKCRDIFSINVQTTITESVRSSRHNPQIQVLGSLSVTDKIVLLVDDVTNTGITIQRAKDEIKRLGPSTILTLCPVWDTVNEIDGEHIAECAADYFVDVIHAWARFPWEVATHLSV